MADPRSTGWAFDHPLAVASRTDPRNYDMADLLAAGPRPYRTIPDFDHDVGPMLDQDGVGACVPFTAEEIRNHQENIDEGVFPFTTASAFVSYDWLKHGHGAYPGDGAPDVEGSWAGAVWQMAYVEGMPGADGNARKIRDYWQLQGDPGSEAWLDVLFTTMADFGPVSVASTWPTSWFDGPPSTGIVRYPSGNSGFGHMWTAKGKRTLYGRTFLVCRQHWGASWGIVDQHGRPGEFLIDVAWFTQPLLSRLGECWKTIDITGDDPTPEVDMLTVTDPKPKQLDLGIGQQLYKVDGVTPMTKVSSGGIGVYTPFATDTGGFAARAVVISSGGVRQLAISRGWTNLRDLATVDCTAQVAAERKRWDDWLLTHPK